MTTHIVITGHPSGKKTWLYEHIGRRGAKRLVSTYQANLTRADGSLYWFAVTRDSANVLWRGCEQFAVGGECPASRDCNPYYGHIYHAQRNGQCLILADDQDEKGYFLSGVGSEKRRTILLHAGPSSSHGFMAVAGGRRGWRNFWRELTNTVAQTGLVDIRVHVEPRIF